MATLEIYWSFRSPYSYLAIDRLADIARQYAVAVDFRPVRPLAMREPDFFERGRPQFLPYLFKDVLREAERLGIPFGFPQPDPIRMDMSTGKVDADQPLMTPLMARALAACEQGRGLEFAQVVGRNIWGGRVNWHEDEAMTEAAARVGLDLAALDAWASSNSEKVRLAIKTNEAAQLIQHWGVPLMVLNGDDPYYGQDRIDALRWKLDKDGLAK